MRRTPETLADYLVVAICPTLIGLLVGSLMFFLVEVLYAGEFRFRLLFVMAMFVMGIVCIARIAMEEGMAYASLFAFPLAGAVGFAVMTFVPGGMLAWPLMALVWWATHKLTWDSTLMDDAQDASGRGLLEEMGLDPAAGAAGYAPPGTSAPLSAQTVVATADAPEKSWWEQLLEPDRRPHAPGVWVIYFSLAAAPLFGIGGWLAGAADPDVRRRIFWWLVIYVGSGLGLLLATSFLGLRRYLRQRKLQMPLEMTATWLIVGGAMILVMLLVAAVLPRPRAEHSLSRLPFAFASAVQRASRLAVGGEGTRDESADSHVATTAAQEGQQTQREGEEGASGRQSSSKGSKSSNKGGKGAGRQGDNGQSQSSDSGDSQGDGQSSGRAQGKSSGGKGKSSSADRGSQKEASQGDSGNSSPEGNQGDSQARQDDSSLARGEHRPTAAESSPVQRALNQLASHAPQALMTLLKWLFYAALLIVGLVMAVIYRAELYAAWQKLLAELRELWAGWFGRKSPAESASAVTPAAAPPRPFAAFADPFASGAVNQMSWPELVRYTFEAVEAWSRERQCPRHADQTPLEFAQAVAQVEPAIARPLQSLAAAYCQLAYAPHPAAAAPDALRKLWSDLRPA